MSYQFGKAKQLTAGGESLFELDLIGDKSYALVKHESMEERGFDFRVDQETQNETPQGVKTNQNTNATWLINLSENRRISTITFQAFLGSPITDAVLVVRRAGESFYQRPLGAISDTVETTFNLTDADMVPIDFIGATAYVMTIVSQSGLDIDLAGDSFDNPFYKWDFHKLIIEDLAYRVDLDPSVKAGIEGIDFAEAMSLQPGGDCIFQSNHILDTIGAVVLHPAEQERAEDRRMDVANRDDDLNVFLLFADVLTDPSFEFQPFSDSRLLDATLRSGGVQTNVMFKIVDEATGKLIWSSMIAVLPESGNDFKIDFTDTSESNVPVDVFSALNYVFSFSSEDGDVFLLGNSIGDRPKLQVSLIPFFPEEVAYRSDIIPVVKGGIQGIEFDEAMSLQPGGDGTFETNHILGKISHLVMHPAEDERAVDRFIDVTNRDDDLEIFPDLLDTLTNPNFPFQVADDSRLFDIQVMSAGAQTNVMFKIFDQTSGKLVWSSMIGTMPASGIVKIDFTDTDESNVPVDIFGLTFYDFEFSSEDGDVLLLGKTSSGNPWLTASFAPFLSETLAYLSDLTSSEGTFHVDLTTTVPEDDRDGSVFRPYISVNEALGDIGTATVSAQHTLIVASGNYSESFTLPTFTHIVNPGFDAESVRFLDVTFNDVGRSSMERCQVEIFTYDTTAVGGSVNASLTLINVIFKSNSFFTGRGAGSDNVIISTDRFGQNNSITATNVNLIIHNSLSTEFSNNINIVGTSGGSNLLNGFECNVDIQELTIPSAGSLSMTASTGKILFTAKNSVLPIALITGDDVNIHRDANTVFGIVGPGTPTIVNLDKAIQVEYDNAMPALFGILADLTASNVQDAIDETAIAAQLAGSAIVNGSADENPIVLSQGVGVDTYSANVAKFVFIDESDPLNHKRIVKENVAVTDVTITNLNIQRNVFFYMDVEPEIPVIVESLLAPQRQLNRFVSIGNIDLISGVGGDFSDIQAVNTFVHASYSDNDLSHKLHLTRGNFNVFGSEFFANVAGNLQVSITPGQGLRLGVNIQNDFQDPDIIEDDTGIINNVNMQWVDTNGITKTQFQGTDGPLDVANYVPVGNDTPVVVGNAFTIIYLFKFYGSNSIRGHFGNQTFTSIANAEAVINPQGPSPQSDQTLEAQLRTALIVRGTAIDLTEDTDAKFVQLV